MVEKYKPNLDSQEAVETRADRNYAPLRGGVFQLTIADRAFYLFISTDPDALERARQSIDRFGAIEQAIAAERQEARTRKIIATGGQV